jgi:polyisoprenoid-binding protein YceI
VTRTALWGAPAALLTFLVLTGPARAGDTAPAEPATEPVEEASEPITYGLDAQKSWLYVVVLNDTSAMASRLGHDHGIRASTFDGSVVWDTADASACSVEITFPVTALVVDPAGMRERAGLDPDGAVGDSAKSTIKDNMLGKRQLDGSNHPTASYKSRSCDGTTGKVEVTGDLTLRGVTKPVSLTMDVKASEASFSAAGSVTIKATDFGFDPFSNLAGALRNKDEMKLVIDVVGSPGG